jgi:lipoprotein-anchoring transpeptidase ErfK/SrfK
MRYALNIVKIIMLVIFVLLTVNPVEANGLLDSDLDGVPDKDEIEVYYTNPNNRDTDGDGYSDWLELTTGFSPHNPQPVLLEDNDQDKDGLNDRQELNFHTSLINPDTDGDGHKDGDEVRNGYDPRQGDSISLKKRIEINTSAQELSFFLGDVRMDSFIISSGKPSMPTPKGHFIIDEKNPRAWSGSYGLWMPYWMSLNKGRFGIHELPEWPSGYKEGVDHLGQAVSHGCIRLGVGNAEFLYNWAPVGTEVFIY